MVPSGVPQLFARYWGKADPDLAAAGTAYHTLLGHSLDVAACAFVLVERNDALRRQLALSAGTTREAVGLTYAALSALHDVGKLDTRFQRKAPLVADTIRPESAGIPTTRYDHGAEGFRQVEDDEETLVILVRRLGPAALPLLRAVCGHHGTLPSTGEPDPTRVGLSKHMREEDGRARRLFLELVLDFFTRQGASLPWPGVVTGAVVQRLGGLCAVADWIGSNVEHFPYEAVPKDVDEYWDSACVKAHRACGEAGLLRSQPARRGFGDLFPGKTPRNVQLLTEALRLDAPALVIVEAQMGTGKTEAALSIASRYLADGLADGITIALPTMATSNAMFDRVEKLATNLFVGHEVQLALAHSRARRRPAFQRLVARSLRARDPDAPEASVVCARWLLQRKRVLLAQLGVGTVDQALQAALVVRHQFVRMFGLSRNVVIIDEVHAYDAYMEVLLEHLLAWLGALRVPVILLSATLPSERRAALARAWRGDAEEQPILADDLDAAHARPYPLVSVTTATGSDTHALGETPTSRSVEIRCVTSSSRDDENLDVVAEQLVSAAQAGARVVWIRNTVREAQRAYAAVVERADGVPHTLFHARFRGCDRAVIEQAVLRDFGKDARQAGRVLVATQVVEQSLDLDFDEMHTDLAPVDLILQRAGRLHRHDRRRPLGFDDPRLVVHLPSEEDAAALRFGPSRYVYDAGTLWIAHRAMRARDSLNLPNDIRRLVEETYHPSSRAALLALGGDALLAAEGKREDELAARRTKAKRCCIPPTSADPDGGSAMDDDEDTVQAFTRDGCSATLLPFWWDGVKGRSLDATDDDPEWDLNAAAPDAWRLVSDLSDQTLSLPAVGDAVGLPDTASNSWDAWQQQFHRFAEESGLGRRAVPLPLIRGRDAQKGWLRMNGRRRRVLYTKELGLVLPTERDEEQQR